MELIYKEKLIEAINDCDYCDHCRLSGCLCVCDNYTNEEAIVNLIKDIPAVDAVPVVRCKDCENLQEQTMWIFGEEHRWCRFCGWRAADWYCASAERKDLSIEKTSDKNNR